MPMGYELYPTTVLCCNVSVRAVVYRIYHIGVGSALLVSINWAMREPLSVRRATGTGSHAFLFTLRYIAESGELIGNG